ncbi:hypothetical protein [Bacillus nakamurai]|uniref:hypothetical protein n=1 Tax=Bacillus nakamurai TaxID=1793963 RepID=UPI001E38C91E|nr:hypothetical protein [Bacillus nakamurai]MCC9021782.1 hypothetical protein [Bacillus nakamurai]
MPKWRNQINIKQYLTNKGTNEAVHNFAKMVLPELKYILRKEERRIEKGNNNALDEFFLDDFKIVVENFEWIKESIENGEDPTEFDFDSWADALNEYLDCLYDIGDTVTILGDLRCNNEKFLWVS